MFYEILSTSGMIENMKISKDIPIGADYVAVCLITFFYGLLKKGK